MAISYTNQDEAVLKILRTWHEHKSWGTITLVLDHGNVVDIRTAQNFKPGRLVNGEDTIVCVKEKSESP